MDQDPIFVRRSSILYVVNLGTSRYSKKKRVPGLLLVHKFLNLAILQTEKSVPPSDMVPEPLYTFIFARLFVVNFSQLFFKIVLFHSLTYVYDIYFCGIWWCPYDSEVIPSCSMYRLLS
eukprot:SAG11_NODE_58_length_19205_cov_30.697315_14_plen_119_part_00